jgi:hypothetical protein
MTIMAVESFVFTLGPAVIGRLHEMAANTEFGIVLGKIVELIGNVAAAAHDDEDERRNEHLGLQGNGLFQPFHEPGQLFSKPTNQLRDPPAQTGKTTTEIL